MKKIYCIAAVALMLAGCTNWLDVKPRGQMPESEVFASESGYQQALIGIYTQMAATSLYGENVTMKIPEFIAQNWYVVPAEVATTDRGEFSTFKYDNRTKGVVSSVWTSYYKAIAQLNVILRNMEETDVSFYGDHKEVIWGEAIGLRAMLHFDLLRFFGNVPLMATDESMALPYLRESTTNIDKLTSVTWGTYKELLWEDINRSMELLDEVDPIFHYDQTEMSSSAQNNEGKNFAPDMWDQNRRRRFNYWAAVGTAARMHSWFGDKAKAAELALEIIEAKDYKGDALFPLANTTSLSGTFVNLSMNVEHIFGVHNPDLQDKIVKLYDGAPVHLAGATRPIYCQTEAALTSALEGNVNPDDIRRENLYWSVWDVNASIPVYGYRKYTYTEAGDTDTATNRVSVMRVAEFYFMVFEGTDVASTVTNDLLKDFVEARNMDNDLSISTNEGNKMAMIEREMRKDFFGEGQMFHLFKRLNRDELTWPVTKRVPTSAIPEGVGSGWVLLKPDGQTTFDPYPKDEE